MINIFIFIYLLHGTLARAATQTPSISPSVKKNIAGLLQQTATPPSKKDVSRQNMALATAALLSLSLYALRKRFARRYPTRGHLGSKRAPQQQEAFQNEMTEAIFKKNRTPFTGKKGVSIEIIDAEDIQKALKNIESIKKNHPNLPQLWIEKKQGLLKKEILESQSLLESLYKEPGATSLLPEIDAHIQKLEKKIKQLDIMKKDNPAPFWEKMKAKMQNGLNITDMTPETHNERHFQGLFAELFDNP